MVRTPIEPGKDALDGGSSSQWVLIVAPGQDTQTGYSINIPYRGMLCVLNRIASSRRLQRVHTTYHFSTVKKIIIGHPKSTPMGFFQGTQDKLKQPRQPVHQCSNHRNSAVFRNNYVLTTEA